jgi:hypothetical protein
MSNGKLEFHLPGIYVNGEFKDGHLISGNMHIADIKYEGTFNENSLLDGPYCSMQIDEIRYVGLFKDGDLISGSTYRNDTLIEHGDYTFTIGTKRPMLKSGLKHYDSDEYYDELNYSADSKEITITMVGNFDRNGYLTDGSISTLDKFYRGRFEYNNLIEGVASYRINGEPFMVELDTIWQDHRNLLTKCKVGWDGPIEILPRKLLMYVICQGDNVAPLHKFYLDHLKDFSVHELLNFNISEIITLNIYDTLTLKMLEKNINLLRNKVEKK